MEGSDRRVAIDDFSQVAQKGASGDTFDSKRLLSRINRLSVEPDRTDQYEWEDKEDPGDDEGCHAKDRQQIVEVDVASSD